MGTTCTSPVWGPFATLRGSICNSPFRGLYAYLRFGVHLHISVWGTICISPFGGPCAYLRFVDRMTVIGDQMTGTHVFKVRYIDVIGYAFVHG